MNIGKSCYQCGHNLTTNVEIINGIKYLGYTCKRCNIILIREQKKN